MIKDGLEFLSYGIAPNDYFTLVQKRFSCDRSTKRGQDDNAARDGVLLSVSFVSSVAHEIPIYVALIASGRLRTVTTICFTFQQNHLDHVRLCPKAHACMGNRDRGHAKNETRVVPKIQLELSENIFLGFSHWRARYMAIDCAIVVFRESRVG
jgi:hypothetical protein